MKLFYKGEYLKTITQEKFEELKNYKGPQVVVDGQLLEKNKLTTGKEVEMENKMMSDYTKEELHSILGDFEEEYNKSATGKEIHNEIIGFVKKGTIDYALRIGAITIHTVNEEYRYFVKLPGYNNYQKKLNALRELIGRRDYAKSKVGGQE